MNKKIILIFIFLLVTNCSFNSKSKFWTNEKIIETDKDSKITEIFKKEKIFKKELNSNLKIKLTGKIINNSFINNFDNNNGRTNYNGILKKSSKFNFAKIDRFDFVEPEISFYKNNLIFFDNKGSILKFDNSSKLIWKKNYYTKAEKKINPILFFDNNKDNFFCDFIKDFSVLNCQISLPSSKE